MKAFHPFLLTRQFTYGKSKTGIHKDDIDLNPRAFKGIAMSLTVSSLGREPGEDLFYSEKFRTILETHMSILRSVGITEQSIPGDLAYQYEGDFYGYLSHLGIPLYLHWVYLRVNGFDHPNEFASEGRDPYRRGYNLRLIIPSKDMIEDIRALYLTTKFKS